jgi:phosphoglycolate phosphatase-like HAD superfamily hydrolase
MIRRAALFDFDGTLADSLRDVLAAYNAVAADLSVPAITTEQLMELRKLDHRAVLRELRVPLWKVPRIMTAVRAKLHADSHVAEPFPGIPEALRALERAGFQLGVVSSNSEENIRAFFERHALGLPAIMSCGVSLFGKAARLRKVLARHRLAAAQVAYVGDEVRDVEAGKQVGVRTVAVSWGYGGRGALAAAGADAIADATTQLATLLGA